MMIKNLNSIQGRNIAAKNAMWQRFLMDRRYLHTSDLDQESDNLAFCPVYSANP